MYGLVCTVPFLTPLFSPCVLRCGEGAQLSCRSQAIVRAYKLLCRKCLCVLLGKVGSPSVFFIGSLATVSLTPLPFNGEADIYKQRT